MKLIIHRHPKVNIVFLFLLYCCIALVATYMLGLPKTFVYTIDILNSVLVFFCVYDSGLQIKKNQNRSLKIVGALLLLSITIGYFFNGQSFLLLLWGARNNYRGVLFMFACMYLMKSCYREKALIFFEKMFWIHAVLVLCQYFILGYTGDHIGGVFGVVQGGNSGNNLMLCIASTIIFWRYLHKECSIFKLVITVGSCLAVAAVAELKFFFVEVFIIVGLLIILDGGFSRKIKSLLVLSCGLIVGVYLLYSIFPQWVDYFSFEQIIELLKKGRGLNGTSIDRFSSFPELYKIFYSGKGLKFLFGYGLGSADYSLSFDFLVSSIYNRYVSIGYSRYSYAFLFIELGVVGFVLYSLFIVIPIVVGIKNKNVCEYNSIAVVIGVLCMLLLFYDTTMKIEPQYFAFFILSMPFWNGKERKKEKNFYV